MLLFSGTPDDPVGGYDDLLRSTAVDAFVVTDTYLGNPQAAWLTSERAPFVAFGRPWDDPDATYPWVDVDGAAGTELATDHLLDKGHTRIAWIGWRKDSFIGEDRRSGWTRAMHARDLPTTGLASRVEDTIASGREAARRAARRGPARRRSSAPPTPSPSACCTRCGDRGIHWGKDIAVVGFDDSQVAAGRAGRPHLGAPAARAGGGRAGQGARGSALHAARRRPGVLLTPTLASASARADARFVRLVPNR